MSGRSKSSTHRKMLSQLNQQQKNRALQVVVLVPKPEAKSDVDETSSSKDELQNCFRLTCSDSSSLPPSLP
ncbi:jg23034 [Pararge aegeria aegeria]|uniref:Jg23034 protein n=1 Tax=Pararge aegeria aegeria TaxID=348720 RepID=A0A8S4SQ65_9NEOP|nr:jg23034 [Pararge aegeria aegeria]